MRQLSSFVSKSVVADVVSDGGPGNDKSTHVFIKKKLWWRGGGGWGGGGRRGWRRGRDEVGWMGRESERGGVVCQMAGQILTCAQPQTFKHRRIHGMTVTLW